MVKKIEEVRERHNTLASFGKDMPMVRKKQKKGRTLKTRLDISKKNLNT
jgi:hypothetical protein